MGKLTPLFVRLLLFGVSLYFFIGRTLAYLVTGVLLFIVYFFRNSCLDMEVIKHLVPLDKPFVIAHRCGLMDAPENTITAATEAIKYGAKAVHFSVEFTSDNIPVAFHGNLLDRHTNGTGKLSDVTFQFLSTLDASAQDANKAKFPDEKIPKLDSMVETCFQSKVLIVIEFTGKTERVLSTVKLMFERNSNLYKRTIIASPNPWIIYKLRRSLPNLMCGLLHVDRHLSETPEGDPITNGLYLDYIFYSILDRFLDWSYRTWIWLMCGNSFVFLSRKDVSVSLIEYYKKLGITTVVGLINSKIERDYFVDGLTCPIMSDTLHHKFLSRRDNKIIQGVDKRKATDAEYSARTPGEILNTIAVKRMELMDSIRERRSTINKKD